jgi:hypothetical protein
VREDLHDHDRIHDHGDDPWLTAARARVDIDVYHAVE